MAGVFTDVGDTAGAFADVGNLAGGGIAGDADEAAGVGMTGDASITGDAGAENATGAAGEIDADDAGENWAAGDGSCDSSAPTAARLAAPLSSDAAAARFLPMALALAASTGLCVSDRPPTPLPRIAVWPLEA